MVLQQPVVVAEVTLAETTVARDALGWELALLEFAAGLPDGHVGGLCVCVLRWYQCVFARVGRYVALAS